MARLRKLAMVGAAALSFGAFAADVAFYPFTDGTAGGDAVGATIQNAVNPETLSGTASRTKGDTATVTFLDDVPGRYLYTNATWSAGSIYRTEVYQSIQTSWVTNKPQSITSATTVDFAGLGARLAGLDTWTVELFFKVDEFLYKTYQQNIMFGDDEGIGVCIEHKTDHNSIRSFAETKYNNDNGINKTISLGSGPILPGMWHHLAVKYNSTDRKLTAVLDYTHYGTFTCIYENPSFTDSFMLGNGCSAMRFAALRVADRVLDNSELMRASDVPPQLGDTRFHWSFESNALGDSLGTVVNDVPWRPLVESSNAKQYAYAVDGQEFLATGDGIVTPLVYTYKTKTELGTLTMDGYASNITDSTRAQLVFPDGSVRANTNCAFLAVGPKDDNNTETWGKGASFTMTGTELLTAGDFTAETYWRPDIASWNAILGDDAGNRYRSSVFGIKGAFINDVPGKITTQFAWKLYFDMKETNFTYQVITGVVTGDTGSFSTEDFYSKMKNTYLQKCNDGRLHHYAVVYRVADAGNENKPTVRLYIDHEEATTLTLQHAMVDFPALYKADSVAFVVGNGLNDHPMQGWYDEIRYSARALAPSEFLRLRRPRPPRGMVISFH